MLDQHKVRLLQLALLVAGDVEDVLPLDDARLLDRAKPMTPDGKVKVDAEKVRLREDAQVKAVLDKGKVGFIVLGGSHDLSESLRRVGEGRCE